MVILDVREPEEFTRSHFKTARNIPLSLLKAKGLKDIPKSELIIVYCHGAGSRAAEAQQFLRHMGFRNVTNCVDEDGTAARLRELNQGGV